LFGKVLDFNWHKQDASPNWSKVEFPGSDMCITL
jgi:hypothetical protein